MNESSETEYSLQVSFSRKQFAISIMARLIHLVLTSISFLKIIGQRFPDNIIAELLQIKWWDFPKEIITNNIDMFRAEITPALLTELKELSIDNNRSRVSCQ